MSEAEALTGATGGLSAAAHMDDVPVEQLSINTIRTLAMDAVQAANSGHPGAPMALAPIAYLLSREMRYNPTNPEWLNRDRFVLSAGHASMLLYAMLYLSGYDLPLEEIRNFRQWESRTPGHPEHGHTAGVETTTGPLGQGMMTAVGMAMAEAHLAAVYNRAAYRIVDHHTYVVCSDGDMMEGASHEAGSLAGHLRLGKLIVFYDDNRITIDGSTDLAFSDDTGRRFEAYGWHVQDVGDHANDLDALSSALAAARAETDRPSLIIVRSHIGFGSPNRQDTPAAHGAPLGDEEIVLTKRAYGWPEDETFLVPDRALSHMREAVDRGRTIEAEWNDRLAAWESEYPDLAANLNAALADRPAPGWDADLPRFGTDAGPIATRSASGAAINAIAPHVPWLIGGSADLAGSNDTRIEGSGDFAPGSYAGRNLHWGIREHVMSAASNGLTLHGGVRPYAATFFVFTDYARPAIRLAALMKLPVIYIMTHDSIGLGEDGPTHQPVEHLASLRAMPGLRLIRPADANETVQAWREAIIRTDGPTMLVLSRQKLPVLDQNRYGSALGVSRGAYILADANGEPADILLISTGSEVHVTLAAAAVLSAEGINAWVVSMPSWELFREQNQGYRDDVLPPAVKRRLAVEAGVTLGWKEWVGDEGDVIGMEGFGASAPAGELFSNFGFSIDNVVARARALLED